MKLKQHWGYHFNIFSTGNHWFSKTRKMKGHLWSEFTPVTHLWNIKIISLADSRKNYSKQLITRTNLIWMFEQSCLHCSPSKQPSLLHPHLYAGSRSPELYPGIYVFYCIVLWNMRWAGRFVLTWWMKTLYSDPGPGQSPQTDWVEIILGGYAKCIQSCCSRCRWSLIFHMYIYYRYS